MNAIKIFRRLFLNFLIFQNSKVLKSKILVYWKRDVSFQNDKVTENVLRCSPNIFKEIKNQIMKSINQKKIPFLSSR